MELGERERRSQGEKGRGRKEFHLTKRLTEVPTYARMRTDRRQIMKEGS